MLLHLSVDSFLLGMYQNVDLVTCKVFAVTLDRFILFLKPNDVTIFALLLSYSSN